MRTDKAPGVYVRAGRFRWFSGAPVLALGVAVAFGSGLWGQAQIEVQKPAAQKQNQETPNGKSTVKKPDKKANAGAKKPVPGKGQPTTSGTIKQAISAAVLKEARALYYEGNIVSLKSAEALLEYLARQKEPESDILANWIRCKLEVLFLQDPFATDGPVYSKRLIKFSFKQLGKAYKINKKDPAVLGGLAWLNFQNGDSKLALKYAEKTLAVDPGRVTAWYTLALARGGSLADFLDPGTPRGKAIVKIQELDGGEQKKIDNPYVLEALGKIYLANGQYSQAVAWLERSAAIFQGRPTTPFYLGLAYYNTGEKLKAAKLLQKVAKMDTAARFNEKLRPVYRALRVRLPD